MAGPHDCAALDREDHERAQRRRAAPVRDPGDPRARVRRPMTMTQPLNAQGPVDEPRARRGRASGAWIANSLVSDKSMFATNSPMLFPRAAEFGVNSISTLSTAPTETTTDSR